MKQKGFTLIETMITVAVIAVLATLAAPSFVNTINQTNARKSSDFVAQMINYAKSEALNKNKDVYLSISNTAICLSSTALVTIGHTCDIRTDALQAGATVTNSLSEIKFDKVYGLPPPSNPVITVKYKDILKTITLNILGIITVS